MQPSVITPEDLAIPLIALFYLALCFGVGYTAKRRGRSMFSFTVISLLTTPILSYLILLVAASGSDARMKCPQCAEWIQKDARRCRFCGESLERTASARTF